MIRDTFWLGVSKKDTIIRAAHGSIPFWTFQKRKLDNFDILDFITLEIKVYSPNRANEVLRDFGIGFFLTTAAMLHNLNALVIDVPWGLMT